MSHQNVVATEPTDAVNRRDLDGRLAQMDDDVEAVSFVAAMEGDYHGHAGAGIGAQGRGVDCAG